jgi:phosphate-selective porin OprO/OprP
MLRIAGAFAVLACEILLPFPVAAADEDLRAILRAQQAEIDTLKQELERLKGAPSALSKDLPDAPAIEATPNASAASPAPASHPGAAAVSLAKGRLSFSTDDGQFVTALRSLVQFDTALYHQSAAPSGIQLGSGYNFRRAQIGIEGTVFHDWSYNVTLDLGGSGTEKSGYIYYAYAQYNGLKPFIVRIGASTPPLTIDDATGSGDLVFLERAAAVDLARNIAGGPSRDALTVLSQGDRYLASLSFTGGKVGDAAVFGEQQALVGRLGNLVVDNADFRLLLDAGGTYVLKVPSTAAGRNPPASFSFGIAPELTVDSTGAKLVATQSFDASHVMQWDVDGASTWRNFSAQGGYFGYHVDLRAPGLADPHFMGWYAQASWLLTGENRVYDPATASFRNPQPAHPLGSGAGAFEFAARYSSLDLNFQSGAFGTAAPSAGVRGGRQDIWTFGLNWFPNSIFHFALNYQLFSIDRLAPSGSDLGFRGHAISLRSQFSL